MQQSNNEDFFNIDYWKKVINMPNEMRFISDEIRITKQLNQDVIKLINVMKNQEVVDKLTEKQKVFFQKEFFKPFVINIFKNT